MVHNSNSYIVPFPLKQNTVPVLRVSTVILNTTRSRQLVGAREVLARYSLEGG